MNEHKSEFAASYPVITVIRGMWLSHILLLFYRNSLVPPVRFFLFQVVSDGSIAMQSCEEGSIVSSVRQAGLIIVQGKSGPAWTEEWLLAVTSW